MMKVHYSHCTNNTAEHVYTVVGMMVRRLWPDEGQPATEHWWTVGSLARPGLPQQPHCTLSRRTPPPPPPPATGAGGAVGPEPETHRSNLTTIPSTGRWGSGHHATCPTSHISLQDVQYAASLSTIVVQEPVGWEGKFYREKKLLFFNCRLWSEGWLMWEKSLCRMAHVCE